VLTIEFEILGMQYIFKFTEAISLMMTCKELAEIDYYWDALTAYGGEERV
jgi:predicted 3-demethylubiquinone-9 3-methyltransferase (glyoxalase superfamily)